MPNLQKTIKTVSVELYRTQVTIGFQFRTALWPLINNINKKKVIFNSHYQLFNNIIVNLIYIL